jgi:predicted transposase YbfD/YdcC
MVTDMRQEKKVLHKMSDVIALVFLATLGNANEWREIEIFGKEHEGYLRKHLELGNGIPSHDTIQRVFAMVSPEFLMGFQKRWNEVLNGGSGEKLKKIFALDGKTQRGTKRGGQEPNHIVSCVDDNGFCLSQQLVADKTNEIKAIPILLDDLNIKGHIVTTDAMGCQKDIAKLIAKKKADYVLALKGNHGNLHEDVKLYFEDAAFRAGSAYTRTAEKARSSVEIREYWQTEDINWLADKKEWAKLKSVVMTRNTITKGDKTTVETRYFISSLGIDETPEGEKTANEVARAVRGHWHLDVTFKEDNDTTLEKQAAYNLFLTHNVKVHKNMLVRC